MPSLPSLTQTNENRRYQVRGKRHPIVRVLACVALAAALGATIARVQSAEKPSNILLLCQNPLCVPSRTSILTGRYSRSTGVYGNRDVISRDAISFTQRLRAGGLKTACFGKLHIEGRNDLDWDVVESGRGGPGGRRPGGARAAGGRRGRPGAEQGRRGRPQAERGRPGRPRAEEGRGRGPRGRRRRGGGSSLGGRPLDIEDERHSDYQAMQGTIKFMEENRDRSWFIQCSFRKPHPPFEPPKRHWDRIDRSKLKVPQYPEDDLEDTALLSRQRRGRGGRLDDRTILDAMQGYYGCIAFCDDMFGQVLATLDRLGLREKTLVLFTADHGEMLYDHRLWGKTNFFEASVHVPLIVSWPGHLPQGQTSDALVELTDLFPTFMDFLGLETPAAAEGRSLVPVLRGETKRHRDLVHSETSAGMTMQFDGRLKFILNRSDTDPELYDLHDDLREITNLARDPTRKEQVRRLTAQLIAWKKGAPVRAVAPAGGSRVRVPQSDEPARERK